MPKTVAGMNFCLRNLGVFKRAFLASFNDEKSVVYTYESDGKKAFSIIFEREDQRNVFIDSKFS